MKKIVSVALCLVLAALFCFGAAAEGATTALTAYQSGTLTFAETTAGAEAAFDGDNKTAFAGSITGRFAKRSVLMGVSVRAGKKIRNLRVLGSEDGAEWMELFSAEKISTVAVFGYNGALDEAGEENYASSNLSQMFTYALRYLRVELEYGSIAELTLRGYETDVTGKLAPLDPSYGDGNGWTSTRSFYNDGRTRYVFDHCVGSGDHGEAFLGDATAEQHAFIAAKFALTTPMTALALLHKSEDKNYNRWNGMIVDVSADGETWVNAYTFPSNAADTMASTIAGREMMFFYFSGENNYRYVRVTGAKYSAVGISEIDVYNAEPEGTAPVNVLSGWNGDPYQGEAAPAESTEKTTFATDPVTEPAATESAPATTAASGGKSSGGCGSIVGGAGVLLALVPAACPLPRRKKRK